MPGAATDPERSRVLVIVLAGGRGRRLRSSPIEKPLLPVGGVPMLVRVVSALASVPNVDLRVATSSLAPRVRSVCRNLGVSTVSTPGRGYPSDVGFLLDRFPRFATVSADLPFLTCRTLARFVRDVQSSDHGWIGVLPAALCRLPIPPDLAWQTRPGGRVQGRLVGINWVVGRPRGADRIYLFDDPDLEFNVNRPADLAIARRHAGEGARPRPRPRARSEPPTPAGPSGPPS